MIAATDEDDYGIQAIELFIMKKFYDKNRGLLNTLIEGVNEVARRISVEDDYIRIKIYPSHHNEYNERIDG